MEHIRIRPRNAEFENKMILRDLLEFMEGGEQIVISDNCDGILECTREQALDINLYANSIVISFRHSSIYNKIFIEVNSK